MASLSRTVQIETPAQLIEAYNNWACPNFSIISGKQLLFAYDEPDGTIEQGEEFLRWWSDRIYEKGSAGIYTLCIYKGLNGKEITNSTPYNGSVNFQFHVYKYDSPYTNPGTVRFNEGGDMKVLIDKVNALTEQVKRLEEGEEGEEEEEGDAERIIGKISTLLGNPVIAGLVGTLFGGSKELPAAVEPGKVQRIAGVSVSEPDNKLIGECIERLKLATDRLPDVLCKLAALAEKSPTKFKFYETMLLNMQF